MRRPAWGSRERIFHNKLYRVFNNSTCEPVDRASKLVDGLHGAAGVPSARTNTTGAAEGEHVYPRPFSAARPCMRRRGDPAEGARRAMHWRPHACMGESAAIFPAISLPLAFINTTPCALRACQYQWHRVGGVGGPALYLRPLRRIFNCCCLVPSAAAAPHL
jgi:hypothetical protein